MTRSGILLSLFVLSLPITVRMGGPDSTRGEDGESFAHLEPGTSLTVSGGGGTYGLVTRGCEDQIVEAWRSDYRDVAVRVEHRTRGIASYGMRGGIVEERIRLERAPDFGEPERVPAGRLTHRYLNPYVRLDETAVGVSAGAFFIDAPLLREGGEQASRFSASVRLGRADRVALRIAYLEGEPLLSDGGYFTIGPRIATWRDFEAFVGTSFGGPDERASFVLRGSWWPAATTAVHFGGRIGAGDAVPQYGASIGVTVRTPPTSP